MINAEIIHSDEELTQYYWYDAAYTNDMNIDLFLTDYIDARESNSSFLEGQCVLFDRAKRDRDPYVGDFPVAGRTLYLTHPAVAAAAAAKNVLLDLAQHQRDDGWTPPASIRSYTKYILFHSLTIRSAGAYLDSTVGPVRHAQDGNSIAILSGATPLNQSQSALAYLDANMRQSYGNAFYDAQGNVLNPAAGFSTRVYAFISYFEISARFETNLTDQAIDQIKRMYGWMATHDPLVTMWEGIGAEGTLYEGGFTSCAHGWSTGVLPALTNYVLGVKPTQTGFSKLSVRPSVPEGMSWARGVVPTPLGDVGVDWKIDGGTFTLIVTAPKGSEATISVPVGEDGKVTVGAQAVWGRGESKGLGAHFRDGYVTVDTTQLR
ncbi:glycoside hydrolase family 78 protein [Pleomassaria siparia CBS 279.74]|uniref:Glycoside hydrolase family 78 protein n=1 Tax=Pleomassaria siparia CBS 279.74 TaxID=1314801 RepID=A0A6G1KPL2_9PLEO|nr:glycoside hydrolase family 78 protein [Pleomassaria siparia CBS 279.74]